MTAAAAAQSIVWGVCALVCAATLTGDRRRGAAELGALVAALLLVAGALWAPTPAIGYGLLVPVTLLHAWRAWSATRTGAVGLLLAAAATAAAAGALHAGRGDAAFVASLVAIGLRSGVMPLHVGVAALTERAPRVQTRQLGTTIALVYLHLRDVDHVPLAVDLSAPLVVAGSVATLVPALCALAAEEAIAWLRSSTVMHAGLLLCGLGAAGNGHYGAALLAALTLALALGGMGVVLAALEDRCGRVALRDLGGRARSFPALAAAFAVFGGAGVGLPATAGFIADDLLLHALWEESRVAAVLVIIASALLAVATLAAWSRVFLGPPRPSYAPDLSRGERRTLVVLLLALMLIGLAPQVLLDPVNQTLGIAPSDARPPSRRAGG